MDVIKRELRNKIGSNSRMPLKNDSLLCELFHENSKFTATSAKRAGKAMQALNHKPEVLSMMSQSYKVYSLAPKIALSLPTPNNNLEKTIVKRRSLREYSGEYITLEQLTRLLYFAYGRTSGEQFRAVASGGALYPLEIYSIVFRVAGLEQGIYHYGADNHVLHKIKTGSFSNECRQCIFMDETGVQVDTANAIIILTALFERSTTKYGDRGYRMTLMEAGEVAQAISLKAVDENLGCCLLGGFLDDKVNQLIGIDGTVESTLLPIVIGTPNK
ncbi:SagB/ThcOx family dehydrogenase [Spartinivicinus poritis]|uniref:SagB/ThcOx family dehydrogenase n=1 Tax=Spartinivicinus poritis TaxID=2994640 RepID=A0ABT5UF82_9GAMM|nr:SagB/ThcOx family dehydrogenase [Spartinivicinus sp. A2-2]MDE1464850.1 SagB/ThcOx family dehydrogenase [Spartinivicinus sp. A2-2]